MEKIVIFFKEANVHMFLFLFFIKFLFKKNSNLYVDKTI